MQEPKMSSAQNLEGDEAGQPNLSRAAPKVGAGCAAYVTIMGFVAFFGQDRGVAAYVFIVGVFISPMELPLLCNKCWPWVNEMMLTSLNLNNWLLRGILYVLLTFIMFLGDDVTILAGVGLMFSGIMYILAHVQGLREPAHLGSGESVPIIHTPAATLTMVV
mmetsp:Transcript_28881/g.55317  ORF Transcript_28881/g.55317 Transcript_28881/m.55317 type:complete len:162 (-) Transcript_28881:530-1015(-)